MPVDVTGARGTGNVNQAQRRTEMDSKILLLEPDSAPLTLLSAKAGSKVTGNPEYKWQEDALAPRFDLINAVGGYAAGIAALVVDNGTYFAQHDLVKVTRSGEVFRVTSVAGATLTVVRGVGGGAAAILDNDELLIVGSAQPEGDTSKPARSGNPVTHSNYTQITRTPFESTETLRHSATFTEPTDWAYNSNKAGIEHAKSLEYTYWHGRPSEDLTGSQPRRTSGGAFYYITTNVTVMGGAITTATLEAALRPAFRFNSGPREKTAFGSALALSVLNGLAVGKLQVMQNDQTFGLSITRYVSPHGVINFVYHPLFEGAVYGGYIAIIDLPAVRKRFLGNQEGSRDTHVLDGIQANDADTMKSEYLSETGLQFGEEKKHALITNITA